VTQLDTNELNRKHTDPAKATKASQHLVVEEAALGRVGLGLVQQVVDEVYAGLHGENHPLLHQTAHPKTLQSRLVNALHPLDNSTVNEKGSTFDTID